LEDEAVQSLVPPAASVEHDEDDSTLDDWLDELEEEDEADDHGEEEGVQDQEEQVDIAVHVCMRRCIVREDAKEDEADRQNELLKRQAQLLQSRYQYRNLSNVFMANVQTVAEILRECSSDWKYVRNEWNGQAERHADCYS